MKNILLLNSVKAGIYLVFFLLLNFKSSGQDNRCRVFGIHPSMFQSSAQNSSQSITPRVIKVYYINYKNTLNDDISVSDVEIDEVHNQLNLFFAGTQFSFVYDPCETITITNNRLYEGLAGPNACEYFSPNRHTDGIDIHLPQDDYDYFGYASSTPGDEFVVGGIVADVPLNLTSVLAHEMGHNLGLFHTFQGSCPGVTPVSKNCAGVIYMYPPGGDGIDDTPFDPYIATNYSCQLSSWCLPIEEEDPPLLDNFMSYANDFCRNNFTNGQINKMHQKVLPEVLYTGPAHQNMVLNVNQSTTISTSRVYTSITVLPGKTLTITNCTLNIVDNITILGTGRLIVDNATLTKCPNRQNWNGIIVRDGGTVITRNEAHIDYAITGIATPKKSADYLVECTNTHFNDNKKGVYLGPSRYSNGSYINYCTFNTGEVGAEISGSKSTYTDGFRFWNNTLNLLTKEGVLVWNTKCDISNDNIFNGCTFGISFRNTFGNPSTDSKVRGNHINGGIWGVYSNNGDLVISSNSYYNPIFGNFFSGNNKFHSFSNLFSGKYTYGEYIASVGSQECKSEKNNYWTYSGITADGNNSRYMFTKNCFGTALKDVNVSSGSKLAEIIGGEQDEIDNTKYWSASNSFSPDPTPDLAIYPSPLVGYMMRKDNLDPPVTIPNTVGNYAKLYFGDLSVIGCELASPPFSEYTYIQSFQCDSTKLDSIIRKLRLNISSIDTTMGTSAQKYKEKIKLFSYNRQLKFAIRQWANCLRTKEAWTQLYYWYKSQAKIEYDIKAAEILVIKRDYNLAEAELSSAMSRYGGVYRLFETMIWNHQLFVDDSLVTQPTSYQLSTLRDVSALSEPYAAYGRALLYKLTGEIIEADTTTIRFANPQGRSKNDTTPKFILQPNPAYNTIQIKSTNMIDESISLNYQISSIFGHTLQQGLYNIGSNIQVSDIPSGLYTITLYDGKQPLMIEKLQIIH